jgi:hypothetical protein
MKIKYAIITAGDSLLGFTNTKDRNILEDELGIDIYDYIEFIEIPVTREPISQLQRLLK